MSLARSQNISTKVPVHIMWGSNGRPVNLTLSPRGTGNQVLMPDSPISSNVSGNSYTWTPNSLVLGGFYLIELSEQGGPPVYSQDLVCTKNSTTITVIIDGSLAPPPTAQSSTLPSSASQLTTSQNSPAHQHTPSQGTIAGVAVGAAFFILLILASAILCWQRRHRFSPKAASEIPGHQTDADIKPDPHNTIWVPELGQEGAVHGPHELPGTPPPLNETARAGGLSPAERRVFEIAESG